jgi:1,4-alpha-glucan branching enzyme
MGYRVGLPVDGMYRVILNSDDRAYGGSGAGSQGEIWAETYAWQNCAFSAPLDLPPLGVLYLQPSNHR